MPKIDPIKFIFGADGAVKYVRKVFDENRT